MCLSFDLVFLHNKAINSKTDRLVDKRGGYCVGVIVCFLVFGGTDSGAWMCGEGKGCHLCEARSGIGGGKPTGAYLLSPKVDLHLLL